MIFDERNRVLLCHRRDMNLWNLPGGKINVGEIPTEAVIREVKEETGLVVKVERLVGVYRKSCDPTDMVFSFVCSITDGRIIQTEEADEIQFFNNKDLPENTIPNQVERIIDATKNLPYPIITRQPNMSSTQHLNSLEKIENG